MEKNLAYIENGYVVKVIAVPDTDLDTINNSGGVIIPDTINVYIGCGWDGNKFSWPPDNRTLDEIKYAKLYEIDFSRNTELTRNVISGGNSWQADAKSVALLNGAITLAMAGAPMLPTVWRTSDNINIPITALADLLAIAGAIAVQTQTAYAKSWDLKSQVNAATTITGIEAITW